MYAIIWLMQAMIDVQETYLNPLPAPTNKVAKKRIRNRVPRRCMEVKNWMSILKLDISHSSWLYFKSCKTWEQSVYRIGYL
jgi:hypothetical protein